RYRATDKPSVEMTAACEKVFSQGIPELLKGPKAADISSACQYSDDLKKASPAFSKACVDVMTADYATKKAKLIAARDAGNDDYTACYDAQSAAAGVSEAAKKEADNLCTELTAAQSAKQGLTEAQSNIAAKTDQLSYY